MPNTVNFDFKPALNFVRDIGRAFVSDLAGSLMEVRNIRLTVSSNPREALENSNGKHLLVVNPNLGDPEVRRGLVVAGACVAAGTLSKLGLPTADAAPVAGPSESCSEALANSLNVCPGDTDFCAALNGQPQAPDCDLTRLYDACSDAELGQIGETYCGGEVTRPTTTGTTPTTSETMPTTSETMPTTSETMPTTSETTPTTSGTTPTTTGPTPTTTGTTPTTTGTIPTTTGTTPTPTSPTPTTTTTGMPSIQDDSGPNVGGIVGGTVAGVLAVGGIAAAYCLKDKILGVRNEGTNEIAAFVLPPAVLYSAASRTPALGDNTPGPVSNSDSDWDSFSVDGNSPAVGTSISSFGYDTPATGSNSDLGQDSSSADDNSLAVSRNTSFGDDTSATVFYPEPDYIGVAANDEAVKTTKKPSPEEMKVDLEAAGIKTSGMGELEVVLAWAKYKQENDNGLWDGRRSPPARQRGPVTLTRDLKSGLLVASQENSPPNIKEQAQAFAAGSEKV